MCRQVLYLEYLSHIKSTFVGCNPRPPPLSPPEALSGCVEGVSMKEGRVRVLRFTALGAKGGCSHSSEDKDSQSRNLSKSKVTHLAP